MADPAQVASVATATHRASQEHGAHPVFRDAFGQAALPRRTVGDWRSEVNRLLTPIQHLMPVIVERADWPVWLDEADGDPRASAR